MAQGELFCTSAKTLAQFHVVWDDGCASVFRLTEGGDPALEFEITFVRIFDDCDDLAVLFHIDRRNYLCAWRDAIIAFKTRRHIVSFRVPTCRHIVYPHAIDADGNIYLLCERLVELAHGGALNDRVGESALLAYMTRMDVDGVMGPKRALLECEDW